MAGFNSEQASKKWASLQNSAGSSLNAIVQGRATQADFSRVASVLNGLTSLGAQTFANAVSAAEVQAKKFESSYARLEQGIRNDNSANLTAYEQALNAALTTIEPNIVGALKEIIELSSLENNEDLTRTMDTGFAGVQDAIPRDLPSVNDLLSANDLLKEDLLQIDETRWDQREGSLIEKIADVFKSTLRDLADQINKERQAKHAHQQQQQQQQQPMMPQLQLAGPGHGANALVPFTGAQEATDVESRTLVDHAMQLVRPSDTPLLGGPGAGESEMGHSAISGPKISLSQAAEQQIAKAADTQTGLYQKLLDFLQKDDDSTVDEQQEDSDRADAFWRSYKEIVGDPSKSKKKSSDDDGWGWLGTLGSALLLMATNPQLFKTIGDLITQYATWDNLKKAVTTAWDWVGQQAHEVLDWVLNKLHPKTDSVTQKEVDDSRKEPAAALTKDAQNRLKNLTPAQQAQMDAMDAANKDHNPNAKLPDNLKGQGNQSWQSWVANKLGITVGADQVNLEGSDLSVGSTSNAANSVDVGGASVNVGGNRSTVNGGSTVNNNSMSSTTSIPALTANISNGVSVPMGGVTSGMQGMAGTEDTRLSKGAPQIGMSTFSFHTGVDDSLMMMNTRYFTD